MRKIVTPRIFLSVLLVLTLLISAIYFPYNAKASTYSINLLKNFLTIEHPYVILQNGTDNVSDIYLNGTSAKIRITNSSTYNYSLNIVNNNSSSWKVKLECFNSSGLNYTNATIVLHNNTTSFWQIKIEGGSLSQNNAYFDLAVNATIYIGVQNLVSVSSGTTILNTYLRIKIPDKTTYALYIITFEFEFNT
jgi:hypothetical protein